MDLLAELERVGGRPGNTPPTNRKGESGTPGNQASTLVAGGIDWLSASCYGSWQQGPWVKLRKLLEAAKLQSQQDGEPGTIEGPDGDVIVVHSSGGREKGFGFAWRLEWQGITIKLADRQGEHDTMPSLIVELRSLTLMTYGHVLAWAQARRLLQGLGFRESRAVPGRCDLCIDLAGIHVREFVRPWLEDRFVCRGRDWAQFGSGVRANSTGFRQGGDVMIRVYNKALEVQKTGDEAKLDVLVTTRWGEDFDGVATRVEFQLRREPLKNQFDVKTVDDLFAKLGSIAKWLCDDWCRFTEVEPDRKNGHEKDAAVLPLWERVREAFASWTAEAKEPIGDRPRFMPTCEKYRKQVVGLLTSMAVQMGRPIYQAADLLAFSMEQLAPAIDRDAVKACGDKSMWWQAQGPGRGLAWSDAIPY